MVGRGQCCISSSPVLSSSGRCLEPTLTQRLGSGVEVASAYLGLDSQDDFRQGHDEALEGNGDILQHKVGNPHDPQQVKEIQCLQVGLQEYEAGGAFGESVSHLDPGPIIFHSLGGLANITNRKHTDLVVTPVWSASPSTTDLCVTLDGTVNLPEP